MLIDTRVDVVDSGPITYSLIARAQGGDIAARCDNATLQEAVDFHMRWLAFPEEARASIEQDLIRLVVNCS